MEYMSNADVVIRDDVTDEELIDAILYNRVYLPAFVVLNKIDHSDVNIEIVRISAKKGTGLDILKKTIVKQLGLIRVYLRPEGKTIEEKPMVVCHGASVKEICARLHRDFVEKFRFAILNGPSASFPDQRVGLTHRVKDGDVLMIVTR